MDKKLSIKQEKFCYFYIEFEGDGTKAAIASGYSERSASAIASENLRKPYIMNYIEVLRKQFASEKIADICELQEFWTEVMRNEKKEYQITERLKASEVLGKSKGVFTDNRRTEIDGEIHIIIDYGDEE